MYDIPFYFLPAYVVPMLVYEDVNSNREERARDFGERGN